jgi:thiol:disulfide interchange protein DsbD
MSEIQNAGSWQPFSMDKVIELRAQGKAVFVGFTAKWCLICQTNKVTLHSAEIQKAFAEKNVVPLVADWTKKDSTIGAVLQQLGRSGVPVYLLYPADPTQPPLILPQTLTKATMHEYLDKLNTLNAAR